jgi:hypothetical protein
MRIAVAIQELCARLGVSSVADVACGEGFWQPSLPGYAGYDIAPEAIQAARKFHPDRDYAIADLRLDCPYAELIICRDAIQHMTIRDGVKALENIKASGAKWLLASTYVEGANSIDRGGRYLYHEPNLEAPPYNMPPAMLFIRDGYDYEQGQAIRDWRKMLALWDLKSR